jgi:ABC-type glycerol-3-phosphate transport system permease component
MKIDINREVCMGKSPRVSIGRAITLTVLILGAVVVSLPFYWLVSSALKSPQQLWEFPPILLPRPPQFQNFYEALTILPFGIYLRNTLLVVGLRELGVVLASSFCAYGFARIRFFARDFIFMLVLATIMIPGAVLIIPRYVIFRQLDWIDTFLPLTVPYLFGGGPFNIFLLRQFFRTIPRDLSDAAQIDGCSHLGIYWRIMMPLAKPAIATVSIFTFLGAWNEFMAPLLYLVSPDKLTVAVGLQQFRGNYSTDWHLLMAASTAMILPVIAAFFLGQRYFIEGAVISGIKG